jgi:hypothetical protein
MLTNGMTISGANYRRLAQLQVRHRADEKQMCVSQEMAA